MNRSNAFISNHLPVNKRRKQINLHFKLRKKKYSSKKKCKTIMRSNSKIENKKLSVQPARMTEQEVHIARR